MLRVKTAVPGAIQAAIDAAAGAGGDTVVVPAGEYPCARLEMKSGVHLVLEEGARVLGTHDDPDDVPDALVCASGARGVRIGGAGVFDGRGTIDAYPEKKAKRPRGFLFRECSDVVVEGITFRNSASWGLHFAQCEDLKIDGVTVFNHNNRNNDGIDICDCARVSITNCDVSSDDDGICLKSFTPRGCSDIEVTDCTVASHCNALKTGTESYGAFRNISFRDCRVVGAKSDEVFYGTALGQSAICITNVDGAALEDIHVGDIEVTSGTAIPIFLRLGARLRPYANPAARPVGTFRRVTLERIRAHGTASSPHACALAGVSVDGATHYLEDIELRDIDVRYAGDGGDALEKVAEMPDSYPHANILGALPAWGLYCRHVRGLKLRDVHVSCEGDERRAPITYDDVLRIDDSAG